MSRGVEARKYLKECARARSHVRLWSKAVMTVVQLVDDLAARRRAALKRRSNYMRAIS